MSPTLSTLLRHGDLPRQEDGSIEFWRSKDDLRNGMILCTLNIGLMKCGRVQWQKAEVTRKDFNSVLTHQDKFYLGDLHDHSGRNLIDPPFQNSVIIPNDFFE